jgi:6-phosphofructokinase
MPTKLERNDKICVLTSGGDAPGMNSALRAAARVG